MHLKDYFLNMKPILYRCFVPGASNHTFGTCGRIDFWEGAKHPYTVKGFHLCSEIPEIEPCLMQDMLAIAKSASKEIGVYVRVDMFVHQNKTIFLNEISTNHLNGLKHCSARADNQTNCVDSCFQGNMWSETSVDGNFTLGGSLMPPPHADFARFLTLQDDEARCEMISSLTANRTASSCEAPRPIAGSGEESMKPPTPPTTPQTMCPKDLPEEGQQCALPDMLDCFYDEICCPDGCEFASCCQCVNGTFVCAHEKAPYCPAVCPPQSPDDGDICSITKEGFHCAYNDHCCESGVLCFVATSCRCEDGQFDCNHLNTTDICSSFEF